MLLDFVAFRINCPTPLQKYKNGMMLNFDFTHVSTPPASLPAADLLLTLYESIEAKSISSVRTNSSDFRFYARNGKQLYTLLRSTLMPSGSQIIHVSKIKSIDLGFAVLSMLKNCTSTFAFGTSGDASFGISGDAS